MNPSVIEYIKQRSTTVLRCINVYLERYNTVSNQTILAIFRTIENEVIKQFSLENCRKIHNRIRDYLLRFILIEV